MTVGKATAMTAAFIGVFVLGVAVSPSVRDLFPDHQPRAAVEPAQTTATPVADQTPTRAPARSTPRTTRAKASNENPATPASSRRSTPARPAMPASEPRLHARLKPVLNSGARMTVAAEADVNAFERFPRGG